MKKLSIVLLAVLLIASLIISCDNSTKALTDELVEVQLGTQAGSRALSSSVTLEQISDPSLTWYYSATKRSQEAFQTGATTGSEIALGTTKTFSQGKWDFELWAKKNGVKVYSGELNDVLITKSALPVSVIINVSPYVSDVDGSVQFSGVMIRKHAEPDATSFEYVEANRVSVNGNPVTLTHGDSSEISLPAGSHTAIVSYVGDDTVTYAYEEIAFTVYSGRTTTINGFVGEDTATGEITAISTAAKVEISVPVVTTTSGSKVSQETTFTAPVNPANDKTQNTSVKFPQGALPVKADGNASTVNLSVETKNVDSNFSASCITAQNTQVVSGIDLKVTVNGSNVTKFNDQTVEVTTFIAKGLSNVVVYYDGTALGTDSFNYVSGTGALTIRTAHFSEFFVAATPFEALNTRTNKASTLIVAIEEAQSGDTIKLYNDVTSSSMITIEKANLILDLNGKIIKNNNTLRDDGTTIKNKGTLTIKDSIGSGKVESASNVAIAAGNNSITTIESGSYLGPEGAVITSYATGATININGGTFTATDNAVIAGNGTNREGNANEININGGTFNGGIVSKDYVACGIYAPWKDVINVSDGTFNITKGAGIVARAGNVNVSGGEFNCTGNVTGMVGDSRIVVPCSALVFDSQANYYAMTDDSKITVTGGTFNSEVASIATVPITDVSRVVVSNGTFSTDPSKYLADGYKADLAESENNNYIVNRASNWAQSFDTSWYKEGHSEYEISNARQLAGFAKLVNEGIINFDDNTVKLVSDIDLLGIEWTPIGIGGRTGSTLSLDSKPFKGTFDGAGYHIKNLKITDSTNKDNNLGLFSSIDGGTIKNFYLDDVNINVTEAKTIGSAAGMMVNNAKADSIFVSGSVNAKEAGGIIGRMTVTGEIKNCTNNANVTTADGGTGGIVGKAYYTASDKIPITISGCTNNGVITANGGYTGGITGLGAATITSCINNGAVTGNGVSIGGIVGESQSYSVISECTNKGKITSNANDYGLGGIVGWARYNGENKDYPKRDKIEVKNSHNYGEIYGENATGVGGIVGMLYNYGSVENNTVHEGTKITGKLFGSGVVGGFQKESQNFYYGKDKTDNSYVEQTTIITNTVEISDDQIICSDCKASIVYSNGYSIVVTGNTPNAESTNTQPEYKQSNNS